MQTNNSKEKVRQLQNKLYLTAKKCDSRIFHALYDKVYRDDVLFEAWKRVKANKGSSGVDGVKIEDVEAMGIEKYLSEIKSELMNGKCYPAFYLILNHPTFNQLKKRHGINYSDRFYIRLLYVVPFVLS